MDCPACEYEKRYREFQRRPSRTTAGSLSLCGSRVLDASDEEFCEKHLTEKKKQVELEQRRQERRVVRREGSDS